MLWVTQPSVGGSYTEGRSGAWSEDLVNDGQGYIAKDLKKKTRSFARVVALHDDNCFYEWNEVI